MSDQELQNQKNISFNLKKENLLWIIGSAAVTVASIQFLGVRAVSWALIISGFVLLGLAVQQSWKRSAQGQPLQRRIDKLDTYAKLSILGVVLFILGIIARFSPQDISVVLIILGLVLLIVGGLHLISGSDTECVNRNGTQKLII